MLLQNNSWQEKLYVYNAVIELRNNIMKITLSQLADIDFGYSFRSKIENEIKGGISVIQMKDLSGDNGSLQESSVKINKEQIKDPFILQKNDVIFRSRGVTNTAVLLGQEIGQAILAAPLMRLRVKSDRILPEYLCWFINQKPAQAFLESRARGTAQRMVTKQSLAELKVDVPPIERQTAIVEMTDMMRQEQKLMASIAKKRRQYVEEQLLYLIREPDYEHKSKSERY